MRLNHTTSTSTRPCRIKTWPYSKTWPAKWAVKLRMICRHRHRKAVLAIAISIRMRNPRQWITRTSVPRCPLKPTWIQTFLVPWMVEVSRGPRARHAWTTRSWAMARLRQCLTISTRACNSHRIRCADYWRLSRRWLASVRMTRLWVTTTRWQIWRLLTSPMVSPITACCTPRRSTTPSWCTRASLKSCKHSKSRRASASTSSSSRSTS